VALRATIEPPWASIAASSEDQRRAVAEREAANRRATDALMLEDAERLITAWNERQAKRVPMLFSPTIGAAIKAGYWFVWVRCQPVIWPARSTCARLTAIPTLP
jgi:hypothetical protein